MKRPIPKHKSKLLQEAATCLEHAAMLLVLTMDYPDCANDISAQAEYLRSESLVEAQKSGLNIWIPHEKNQKG